MKKIILSTLGLATLSPLALHAADPSDTDGDSLNRFSLGARFGLNLKADFRDNAPVLPLSSLPPGQYQDGYVLRDSSGNAGGLTWNWGYQNASQVVGNTMQFHDAPSYSATLPGNDKGVTDDPQAGVELVYQRILGHLPFVSAGRWGLEAGFAYTDFDLRDNGDGTLLTTMTTDSYQLNGVVPPAAGYHGTYNGPGALLGDIPTSSSTSLASSLSSQQKLSGQLYNIRLGPFAEWNFTHKISIAVSVGLALAPAVLDYTFPETDSSAGVLSTGGQASKTGLLYGPFVGATLRYDFSKHWGVYVGAQFESLTDLDVTSGSHSARLDPGAMVYGTAGVTYRF